METSFAVSDTRRACQVENRSGSVLRKISSCHSTHNLTQSSPALTFRADLQEAAQRAAADADHRRLRDANNLRCENEAKAKSQGTLVSVLEQKAGGESDTTTRPVLSSNDNVIRQQFLALAFLITEAHRLKKKQRDLVGKKVVQQQQEGDRKKALPPRAYSSRSNSNTAQVDVGDVKTVKLLLSDFDVLLQQQRLTKVDVEQYVRVQLGKLNMWQH